MKPSAKTVMITGANRGLGLALTEVFGGGGFNLILHSRGPLPYLYMGQDINPVQGDLRSRNTIDALASAAQVKGLDILINNAGVHLAKPLLDMTIDEIQEVIEINLVVPILLTKAIWPIFLKQNSGLVININSLAAHSGGPGESIYGASKAGLAGFGTALQFDAAPAGIRVINLNIGAMKTDMGHDRTGSSKFIDPRDAARAILSFCADYPTMRITSADLKRRVY